MSIPDLSYGLVLAENYQRFTSKSLLPVLSEEALYEAPFALVAHGTEEDPIFNYANKTAQRLWEMDWGEFTKLPSRLSAEAMRREERQQLLERVHQFGFAENYSGIRISKSGKRFWIKDTCVWNIFDPTGIKLGQAATYATWEFI
jgi:hypothetical protein